MQKIEELQWSFNQCVLLTLTYAIENWIFTSTITGQKTKECIRDETRVEDYSRTNNNTKIAPYHEERRITEQGGKKRSRKHPGPGGHIKKMAGIQCMTLAENRKL